MEREGVKVEEGEVRDGVSENQTGIYANGLPET